MQLAGHADASAGEEKLTNQVRASKNCGGLLGLTSSLDRIEGPLCQLYVGEWILQTLDMGNQKKRVASRDADPLGSCF